MSFVKRSEYTTDSSSDDESESKYKKGTAAWTNNKMSNKILPRPHVSNGYWLCALLPLALCTSCFHDFGTDVHTANYKVLTIAAIGMFMNSFCFFVYMHIERWIFLKLIVSLVPCLFTSILFKHVFELTWSYGVLYAFIITFCYQNVYVRVMRGLPNCFTYGEACIIIQGLMLFVLNVVLKLWYIYNGEAIVPQDDFSQLNVIMMSALFLLLVTCALLALSQFLRKPLGFYPLMILLFFAVTCAPVTSPIPVIFLFKFLSFKATRILFVLYLFGLVLLTIGTVCCQLRNTQKASTRVRKIFHALIILVYVPGLIYDCGFLYIASGVALAIFTILELFRVLNIPPLGETLKSAFATFSDEKDSGALALTPFSLLIGCSIPLWLHTSPCVNTNSTSISLLSGVLSTGIGDAAASIVGSKFGRIKWKKSSRTLEGSTAYVLTVSMFSFILAIFEFVPISLMKWLLVLTATVVTALVEAYTDQIDNLILPLIFYTIVTLV